MTAKFNVGDKVMDRFISKITGVIVSIDGDIVIIKCGRYSYTYQLKNLKLVEESE